MKIRNIILLCPLILTSNLKANDKEEGFTQLFNGNDLSGWTKLGGTASYEVKDGSIVGTTAANTPNTFLTTNKHYADFDLRFEVKLENDELNSGCQIRSNSSQDYKNGVVHGYQCEIESQTGTAGFIYDELRRGWLSKDRNDEEKNKAFKKGEWNDFRIVCRGNSIKTWVNGIAIADVTDGMTSSGFIGLQVHSVPGDPKWQVAWRNIRIKEFPNHAESLTKLSDFTTTGNWKVNTEGSIELVPRPGEAGWKRYPSYLWAQKQYGDFVCSFEYQHLKGGNSGFYFRAKDAANPVETGIEIQIIDSFGKKGTLTPHDCGGVIFTREPSKNMAKPAKEWNQMEVRCEGSYLKVWLNSEKIQDMYLNNTGLKDRPLRGHVGIQDHGVPFRIRKFKITELK